ATMSGTSVPRLAFFRRSPARRRSAPADLHRGHDGMAEVKASKRARPAAPDDDAPLGITDLATLAAAENACTRCPLYRNATQAVPGQGSARARVMLVGEQPGDKEDIAGLPFVGPAGRILDRALAEAGIERKS